MKEARLNRLRELIATEFLGNPADTREKEIEAQRELVDVFEQISSELRGRIWDLDQASDIEFLEGKI